MYESYAYETLSASLLGDENDQHDHDYSLGLIGRVTIMMKMVPPDI